MIDTNVAYSYERSAALALETANENRKKWAADYYVEAYIKRQRVSQNCQILGAEAIKMNNANSDNVQRQYQDLAASALETENINVNSKINERSTEFAEYLDQSKNDESAMVDKKVEQLVSENYDSQIDYKNAQELKEQSQNSDKKNVKPW
jgi:hypothetical protein